MDALEIAHRRLANQHLSADGGLDPVGVVHYFGAMQSQEFAVAKWSIGERAGTSSDAAIQKLIDDGTILRTHVLRPTWHFVAAPDIGWLQALTGPRVKSMIAYYCRRNGIDEDLVSKSSRVIARALTGGNNLTRAEMAQALAASKIEASGARLAHLVMRAEIDGLIVSGPMRGKQHTYALIDERAPDRLECSRDEALRELTIRYFTSHGPATIKDFVWWASLTVADIKHGLVLAGEALASEQVDGLTYWFPPGEPPTRDRPPSAHVLQAYDEYVVAYTQSRPIANVAGLDIGPMRDNALVHPIVLDSQVIGFWQRTVTRDGLRARPVTAMPLTAAQRGAVEEAFSRYERFAGVPLTVEWPDESAQGGTR